MTDTNVKEVEEWSGNQPASIMCFDQPTHARPHLGQASRQNHGQCREAVECEQCAREQNLECQYTAFEAQQRRLKTDELAFRPMRQKMFEREYLEEAIRQ